MSTSAGDDADLATQKPLLLLVDDDPLITDSLGFLLSKSYQVIVAASRAEVRPLLASLNTAPAIALIDLGLPPQSHTPEEGFQLIGELMAYDSEMKILVLSGQSDQDNMHHALTLGAVDFIPKPADPALLQSRLQHHLMLKQLETRKQTQQPQSDIIGDSPAMRALREQLSQFADSIFPVLIEGESGTGKELAARALHQLSNRHDQACIAINCAAIAPELLESQLFGHVKGAFTGADRNRAGFFEEANQGSLFLDEIGEMPYELQAKLLRVLESGEYYRVGDTQCRQSSVRIIAATNRDLQQLSAEGRFRSDLFHRLSILRVHLPPLRERENDVIQLLDYFQSYYSDSLRPVTLDPDARSLWLTYEFPGNIRELRNIVIRLCTKYPLQTVTARQLEQEFEQATRQLDLTNSDEELFSSSQIRQQIADGDFNLNEQLKQLEDYAIQQALELYDGNLSKAARALQINRTTLYSRMQKNDSK